jgi:hypothetical protein
VEWVKSLHAKLIMIRSVPSPGAGSSGSLGVTMQQVFTTISNMADTVAHQHEFVVAQMERKKWVLPSLVRMPKNDIYGILARF